MSCCIDWFPTGKANTSTRKERLLEERVFFALLERTSIGIQPDVDQECKCIDREGKATGREKVFFALLNRTSTEKR